MHRMSGMQREAQTRRSSSPLLWTHAHTQYSSTTSRPPPPSALRLHSDNGSMDLYSRSSGDTPEVRGEGGVVIAIFSSTLLTICKSQSKKKCIKMLLKKKKKKSSPIRFAITSWDMKPVAKLNAVQLWYTENRANGCGNTLKKPIVVY